MTRTTASIPVDLKEKIDRERATRAQETGDMPTRSDVVREALREYLSDPDESCQEAEA